MRLFRTDKVYNSILLLLLAHGHDTCKTRHDKTRQMWLAGWMAQPPQAQNYQTGPKSKLSSGLPLEEIPGNARSG